MRLAMHMPSKNGGAGDPREQESAEIIDLASRNAYPAVVERKAGGDWLGLLLGAAVVGLLGLVTFWAMEAARVPEPQPIGNPQVQPPQEVVAAPAPQPIMPNEVEEPVPAPMPVTPIDQQVAVGPMVNPYASPTMIYDASAGTQTSSLAEAAAAAPAAAATMGDAGAEGAAAAFASRIGGVGGAPALATPMTNPATTVVQSTLIPAILETAINTDVPGYVRAVVSADVRGFDGTRVLIPRSSRLIGQYQSGVQNGQRRAYVIWTRLIRPDGVSVNIASPAVAFDGTTGLEGNVDNHFFRRFGSALLLSLVDGIGAIASGGASVVVGGGQSAASTALQQDGQISPTIRVPMGEPIRVFAARDLDFSTVSR